MSDRRQTVVIDADAPDGGFPIDATITETHTLDSEVTEFPVESGADVVDNVRPKPLVVQMECVVSDTPLGLLADAAGREGVSGPSGQRTLVTMPSAQAYLRLRQIRDAREFVTIRTSLDVFRQMVLQSLSIPRSAETGLALQFTCGWLQVTTVENKRETVRTAIPGGGSGKKNLGVKLRVDFSGAVVIWHKPRPLPRWSNYEILGWDEEAASRGQQGFVHSLSYVDSDGKLVHTTPQGSSANPVTGSGFKHLSPEEIELMRFDDRAWATEHDQDGNLVNNPDGSPINPGFAAKVLSLGKPNPNGTFNQATGQWEGASGQPIQQGSQEADWVREVNEVSASQGSLLGEGLGF